MKINKTRHKRTLYYVIFGVVLLIIAALCIWLYVSSRNNTLQSDQTTTEQTDSNSVTPPIDQPATDEQIKAGNDIKKDQQDNNTTSGDEVTVVISSVSVGSDTVSVRAYIEDVVSSGTCTLVMVKGDQTVTKESAVAPGPSITGCQPFSVPTSELGSGTWDIKVSFKNSTKQGSTTTSVTI